MTRHPIICARTPDERKTILRALFALGYKRHDGASEQIIERLSTNPWPEMWIAITPYIRTYVYQTYQDAVQTENTLAYIKVNSLAHMLDFITANRRVGT